VAENISTARAEAFNPQRIEAFFKDVKKLFDKEDLHDILQQLWRNWTELSPKQEKRG
jgi:hypothetical protein